MRSVDSRRVVVLAVATLAVLATGIGAVGEALAVTRGGLADGRWWTLWTGPLVHGDAGHLARDVAWTVALGWVLAARLAPARFWALLLGGLPIPVAAAFLDGPIGRYLGLSGLLYGLIGALGVAVWRTRRGLGVAILAALMAVLVVDVAVGPLYWREGGGRVMAAGAHVAGAAYGVVVATPWAMVARWCRRQPT